MIDYMQKGGPLMWLLLLLSIISITVFFERLIYFHRATIRVGEFLRGLANLILRRNFAEALHESAGTQALSRGLFTPPLFGTMHRDLSLKKLSKKPGSSRFLNLSVT